MALRLGIFVTHPVQYHVPLWRGLAAAEGLDVQVFYYSDHSVRGSVDLDFGVKVAWDVPLLDGYSYEFLSTHANLARPSSVRLPQAEQLIRQHNFDWVFIQGYTHGFERDVIRACRKLDVNCFMRGEFADVDRGRGRLKSQLRTWYLRWFYRHISTFGVIGTHARRHLARFGINEQQMFWSPYTIDTDGFEQRLLQVDRVSARKRFNIPDRDLVILFSGKLIERKSPGTITRAVASLTPEERQRMWLVFVGDGALKASVEAEARALVGSRVIMPGFVNQLGLGNYFALADLFVLPSEFETWGLVVNEAMQASLPVLVSDTVGCQADLVVPGRTGFVFPHGQATELARWLRHFTREPELSLQMGRQARAHIDNFKTSASVRGILAGIGKATSAVAA